MATLKDVRSPEELGDLLEFDYRRIIKHYTHRLPVAKRYESFSIPKKGGGHRLISAPATYLKVIQQRLAEKLDELYVPRSGVHGFVKGLSIISNATPHIS